MNRRLGLLFLFFAVVVLFPNRSPAPLIYVPGEGWHYESYGSNQDWQRTRAKEQLDVAQTFFDQKDYKVASRAARRVVRIWPLSDYAPKAQYLLARCLEATGKDEAAFNAYQHLIEKYPRTDQYNDALWRQYEISGRFLDGEWFKLWGLVPFFPSMDKTADMYEKIVKGGPYSDVAPHAQLRIGAAREKQKNYPDAVKAYGLAADRYHDQPEIAADALYRVALAYQKQAATAEYDQNTAAQAIAAYTDFMTLYPDDKRVADAQKAITSLKAEQVRGNFEIAKFYDKIKKWNGAVVYYNEVLQLDPNSPYATQARERIETLKPRIQPSIN